MPTKPQNLQTDQQKPSTSDALFFTYIGNLIDSTSKENYNLQIQFIKDGNILGEALCLKNSQIQLLKGKWKENCQIQIEFDGQTYIGQLTKNPATEELWDLKAQQKTNPKNELIGKSTLFDAFADLFSEKKILIKSENSKTQKQPVKQSIQPTKEIIKEVNQTQHPSFISQGWWWLDTKFNWPTSMTIKEGYWKLDWTDWEGNWWQEGTNIKYKWINAHASTPGGTFNQAPEGTYILGWKCQETKKDRYIFIFNGYTMSNWMRSPGWRYKSETGQIHDVTNVGNNFKIGAGPWNFEWWFDGIALKSKWLNENHGTITWKGNGRNTGFKFDWMFGTKVIEIFKE